MSDLIPVMVTLATEKEAAAIQKVTVEAFLKYAKQAELPTIDALNEPIETIIHDIQTKLVFIAYIEDEIVGSVRIESFADGTAYLSRFGVLMGHQNAGIGKELMNSVDEMMVQKGIHTLKLHTSSKVGSLVRFYYSRGFYIDEISKEKGYPRALFIKEY